MTMAARTTWRSLALIAVIVGCDQRPSSPPTASARSAGPATEKGVPAPKAGRSRSVATKPASAPQAAQPAASPVIKPAATKPPVDKLPVTKSAATKPAAGPTLEKATVGVGKKGHSYGGGMMTEPLRARFRIEERIVFNHVDYALKLYKAQHGELPKTHEEFMEKIIRANQITLPALPPGDTYLYDPEKGKLMVRHPR